MATHKLAIAASMHLAPTDGQFDIPHLRSHMPQHEAAWLTAASSIAILKKVTGVLKVNGCHAHLANDIEPCHTSTISKTLIF
jgi:hypothetical protein